MAAIEAIPAEALDGYTVLGELALDGSLTPVAGVLPAAIAANARGHGLILPGRLRAEAVWASARPTSWRRAPSSSSPIISRATQILPPVRSRDHAQPAALPDLKDIKGQETAKRALEIAAAGGHNLLMSGPPGAGKILMAARLPSILPR